MRLIYYSLARPFGQSGDAYDDQWIQSIRSLRLHNPRISVCLFTFNGVPELVRREADRWRVQVLHLGNYREWLESNHHHGAILAMYPTLHKFLVLNEADTTGLSQALYLDCDTFFFDDPEILLESTAPVHWWAREAPTSRLSPHGYDPSNVNEEVLAQIAGFEGLQRVAPFNAGVCVLNNRIWETFGQLKTAFFDAAWRLLVGRHCFGTASADDPDIRRAVRERVTEDDRRRSLPYPSDNFWILEEFALWLTLGRIGNFSQGFLTRDFVVQGDEFVAAMDVGRRPVAAHYFSAFRKEFFSRVSRL